MDSRESRRDAITAIFDVSTELARFGFGGYRPELERLKVMLPDPEPLVEVARVDAERSRGRGGSGISSGERRG